MSKRPYSGISTTGRGVASCHQHVDGELDQFGRQGREPLGLPLRKPELESNVVAFHPAQGMQRVPETLPIACRKRIVLAGRHKCPDAPDLLYGLRRGGERHRQHAPDKSDNEPHRAASHGRLLTSAPGALSTGSMQEIRQWTPIPLCADTALLSRRLHCVVRCGRGMEH
jgi:hypothetical protein